MCEYCGNKNIIDVVDEEIPKEQDVTFMLEPAPSTTASGRSGTDTSLVVFCVDTSGSMCVTTEVGQASDQVNLVIINGNSTRCSTLDHTCTIYMYMYVNYTSSKYTW